MERAVCTAVSVTHKHCPLQHVRHNHGNEALEEFKQMSLVLLWNKIVILFI